ncbi:MAG: hypothetical protein AB1540_07540 [Bdellovibrionota bacterium]
MPQDKPSVRNQMNNNLENDLVPLTLRIPKSVHGQLKELSEREFRSLNHQIIMALSYFLDVQEKVGGLPHPDYLRKVIPAGTGTFQPWLKPNGNGVPSGRTPR